MPTSTLQPRAALILEDGRVFLGRGFGELRREAAGEVVFHTGMTGYPEILTDPSYRGQIVTFTAPHIGNVGMPHGDDESGDLRVAGLIVRRLSTHRSGARPSSDLAAVCRERGVPGLSEIDTRALTLHLRERGALRGRIAVLPASESEWDAWFRQQIGLVREQPSMEGRELASQVSARNREHLTAHGARLHHIGLLHLGAKDSIVEQLRQRGCSVTVLPHSTTAQQILELRLDGLLLSNGPGDPAACGETVATVTELLGRLPILGICLGHQILALAAGATTFKLPFGHHGANHPVQDLRDQCVAITSQNHGFAVDETSLSRTDFVVTHRSLYDGTVEGMRCDRLRAASVQYHPEAAPGPHDARNVFDQFLQLVEARVDAAQG